MWVLCHTTAFVRIEKHVINIKRSSYEWLIVGNGGRNRVARRVSRVRTGERCNCPQTLVNWANIEIDFNFVILYITLYPTFRCISCNRGSSTYLKPSLVLIRHFKSKTVSALNLPHILIITDLEAWLRIVYFRLICLHLWDFYHTWVHYFSAILNFRLKIGTTQL